VLPLDEPFRWNEYEITAHEQPGHTLYAVAYSLEVDGVRVVFTGDQQEGLGGRDGRRDIMNYQYRNLFRVGDYSRSAALYKRIAPGLMASGHWEPRWADAAYLDYLVESGAYVDELHHRLLPLDELAIGADGQVAVIAPYRARVARGDTIAYTVRVRNPFAEPADARLGIVVPLGWRSPEAATRIRLGPHEEATVEFNVVAATPGRRQRLAVDVSIGDLLLGQHAEALVDVPVDA
jgi:hypothetical protein